MKRIEEMYAYVAENDDYEGITSIWTPDMGHLPMVGADMARVDSMRDYAQHIADASGRTVRVVRFSVREELEVIQPGGQS